MDDLKSSIRITGGPVLWNLYALLFPFDFVFGHVDADRALNWANHEH